MLRQLLFCLLVCLLSIQIFNSFFLLRVLRISESVFYSQAFLTLQSLLLPKEAEDFLRGDRHFKHVPPPTHLICLSPKDLYTVGSI